MGFVVVIVPFSFVYAVAHLLLMSVSSIWLNDAVKTPVFVASF
jgi:hypothetical protein